MSLIEEAAKTAATIVAPEATIPVKIGTWLLGNSWRLAAIGTLLAVGVQELRIEGVTLRPQAGPFHFTLVDLPGWKPRALAAEKALDARNQAEKAAHAAQIAENHKPAAISTALAEETNAQAPANVARVDAAVAAYARVHPVPVCLRAAGPADLLTGAPDTGRSDPPASDGDGQNIPSDMVALSRADLDGFAANTRDLDALREFLAKLIAKGMAVADTTVPADKKD